MTRLLGPDSSNRLVYRNIGEILRSAAGATATVYADAGGSVLANIAAYQADNPGTPGAVISGSTLTVDYTSQMPLFWFPDGADTVWVSVDGGPLTLYRADFDARIDAIVSSGETAAGAQAKADAAQAAAISAAAADATSKANAAQTAATNAAATDAASKDAALDSRFGRYELARATSPAAGILAALYRGYSTVLQVVSESTALATTPAPGGPAGWPVLLGQRLGAAYPNYNVLVRHWNLTTQWYDAPVSLQAGPSGDSRIVTSGTSIVRYTGTAITGDLDVRLRLKPNSWASGGLQVPISRWDSVGNQRSWWFGVTATGSLCLTWTTDGTSGTQVQKFSTVVNGLSNATPQWVRATLDVDNGAAGNSLIFYTSADGATWTQLGATVVTAGVTSIHAGTAPYQMAALDSSGGSTYSGEVYWAEVRDGIAGVSMVPPLPDTWDQASLSTNNTILMAGSPTILIVNGSEGAQNFAYWNNATRRPKVLSAHAQQLIIAASTHNETYVTNGVWLATLSSFTTGVQALHPDVPLCYLTQNPAKAPAAQNEIDVRARRGISLMHWARTKAGVTAIDTYPAFNDITTQISSDGTHPSAAGQTALREYLYRTLFQAG